jgi:RimJ/RimL family protein N-acetyltransferase
VKPIPLTCGFQIATITKADKPAYLTHFTDGEINAKTLNIPFPYTDADADVWLGFVAERTREQGRATTFALRRPDGFLVGGIGFEGVRLGHRAELGYWLAREHWGQGVMTEAVQKLCELGFRELGLVRIQATVFDFNLASARVLEKTGFSLEGVMRKHAFKGGKFVDVRMYARIR